MEEKLLRDLRDGRAVALERALLGLSGLASEADIQIYQDKIDTIWRRFLDKPDHRSFAGRPPHPWYRHRSIARSLFAYLWNSKPQRFGESFLLTEVVDAQLDPDGRRTVGTCVGLTSLYAVLGLRAGLDLSLLLDSDHLLNRLRVGEQCIDIDHTDPQGFDSQDCRGFSEFPLLTLPANVINCRGLRHERSGRFAAAQADYHQAVEINPEYANAFNNRGNMRVVRADLEGAIADYTEAIRLNPRFHEAYCNRGMAKHRLGLYAEARHDYRLAIRIDAGYADAHRCLRVLDALESPGRGA